MELFFILTAYKVLGILGTLAFLTWYVADVLRTRQTIRDANGDPYLYRYFLYRPDWLSSFGIDPKKAGRIYLHHIIRSDHDRAVHSHPWTFFSLILKGGYWEHRPSSANPDGSINTKATYYGALSLLRRPAPSLHRLVLPEGKTTWSLVFVGPKKMSWGFWTAVNKFCHWRYYDTGTGLCDEPEDNVDAFEVTNA